MSETVRYIRQCSECEAEATRGRLCQYHHERRGWSPRPPAPVPPASGLSDERLAEAAQQVVNYWPVWYEDRENFDAEFHLRVGIEKLRAALSEPRANE
jgi:hypothetical protein